ncbi:hypothetical protein KQ51_00586 [Candidatus Izimaplasma bacterium HR1]|jgi:hypothetical protein|uniref:hypothetical protein n=1 Tax=Candidatus Izimoplasma sp. HR1 TaxID=1541959 RepID=UPI0004F7B4A7|nr:hypothetical protein KQ51_00586 [Candidatus Izimaplasma bacterium HR1]
MKKLYLVILIVLGIFLSSCSGESEGPVGINFESYINYDFEKATFNNTPEYDIIHGLHNYQLEFELLYSNAKSHDLLEKDLSETEINAFNALFTKLEGLNTHDEALFILSSSDFKTLLEGKGVEVTAFDIFTFNAIKNVFDTLNGQVRGVTKVTYLEKLLDLEIDSEDIEGLSLLQELISEIQHYQGYTEFRNLTFDEFLEYVDQQLNYVPSEVNIIKLEEAYIIIDLIE